MSITDIIKKQIKNKGLRQKWVAQQMNLVHPCINMSPAKFSATLNNKRKMTADELIAYCKIVEVDPDELLSYCDYSHWKGDSINA